MSKMKIAILSRSPKCYSTRRLKEAALSRGHDVRVLNTMRFSIDLDEGSPDLYYRGKILSNYDVVIPRIGASITYFGTAVVRQFEQMDVFCANSSAGDLERRRDKLRSRSRSSVPTPHRHPERPTFVNEQVATCCRRSSASAARRSMIKLLRGYAG